MNQSKMYQSQHQPFNASIISALNKSPQRNTILAPNFNPGLEGTKISINNVKSRRNLNKVYDSI